MKKQYIKAVDIVAEVLRKWYILVICVVLMAILVPNFKYLSDKKLVAKNNKLIEQTKEKAQADKEAADKAAAEQESKQNEPVEYPEEYYHAQAQINEWNDYLSNSAFMKLDAYDMANVRLTYEIDDYSVALPAFISYIGRQSMANDLGEQLDNYTSQDIQDMVSCEILGAADNSKVISINIYAANKDEANVLSTAVKDALSDFAKRQGFSSPKLMDENLYEGVFTSIYDTQAANESRTATLVAKRDSYIPQQTNVTDSTVSSAATSESDDTKTVTMEDGTTVDVSKLKTKASFNFGFVFIGMLLGVVFDIVIVIVILCLSDKIRTDSALKDSFGLDYFGRVNIEKKSKWDAFIDKLCYKCYSKENLSMSSLRISKLCNGSGIKELYLTGHISGDMSILNSLLDGLEKKEIEVTWVEDFSQNAESLNKIKKNGALLFVNELRTTCFKDVIQDVNIANEQNINILGYMTVYA